MAGSAEVELTESGRAALGRLAEREEAAAAEAGRARLRSRLKGLVRRQRTAIGERSAELLGSVEAELAERAASTDDEALWAELRTAARDAASAAQRKVRDRARRTGLAESYVPRFRLDWPEGEEVRREGYRQAGIGTGTRLWG